MTILWAAHTLSAYPEFIGAPRQSARFGLSTVPQVRDCRNTPDIEAYSFSPHVGLHQKNDTYQ
jgi:hypothetical protein